MPNESTSSSKSFVDTNVFLYAMDHRDPRKQKVAQSLIEREMNAGTLVVSTQVLNEICAVLIRKIVAPHLTIAAPRSLVWVAPVG